MDLVMNDPGDRFFYRGQVRGLQLRLYRPGDESHIKARRDFAEAFDLEGKLPEGPKWTLTDGGRVLAVGGLEHLNAIKTWGAWAYAGDLTPRQWAFGAMVARAVVAHIDLHEDARRIQAVAADRPGASDLLRRMGFRCEHDRLFTYSEAA